MTEQNRRMRLSGADKLNASRGGFLSETREHRGE